MAKNDLINVAPILKTYKEADNSSHIWLFLEKLKQNQVDDIQQIIGIRFGGIELPYLVREIIYKEAQVTLVKISSYTDQFSESLEVVDGISPKNILIVDDNILTGRTLAQLVEKIRNKNPKNIFFACFSYSGMKRYPQMIMDNHGVVNPEVLKRSCVVTQSDFTRINSSKSYKNKNGVFDKVKKEIQDNLDEYKTFSFKI